MKSKSLCSVRGAERRWSPSAAVRGACPHCRCDERSWAAWGKGGVVAEGPYKLRPTLVDIRNQITAAVVYAEIYSESHPEHAEALHHFYEDITESFQELRDIVYGKPIMDQATHGSDC